MTITFHLTGYQRSRQVPSGMQCNYVTTTTNVLPVDEDVWDSSLSCYLVQDVLILGHYPRFCRRGAYATQRSSKQCSLVRPTTLVQLVQPYYGRVNTMYLEEPLHL